MLPLVCPSSLSLPHHPLTHSKPLPWQLGHPSLPYVWLIFGALSRVLGHPGEKDGSVPIFPESQKAPDALHCEFLGPSVWEPGVGLEATGPSPPGAESQLDELTCSLVSEAPRHTGFVWEVSSLVGGKGRRLWKPPSCLRQGVGTSVGSRPALGQRLASQHAALPREAVIGAQPPSASSSLPLIGPDDVTLWSREVLVLAGHAAHPRRPRLHNCEVSAYSGCRLSARPEMACAGRTSLPPRSLPGFRWGLGGGPDPAGRLAAADGAPSLLEPGAATSDQSWPVWAAAGHRDASTL